MNAIPLTVYVAAVLVLFGKTLAAMTIQGRERIRSRTFRYPEDAAHWKGELRPDTDRCERAQRLLRNEGESQPYFLVLGALYLALGAWPAGAPFYFGAYVLSRVAHAVWLFRGTQPHRNRAFAAGLLILLALAVHVAYEATHLL